MTVPGTSPEQENGVQLADVPANADLLAYRREAARRPYSVGDYALGGWQLNTHPDLVERLTSLAPDPADVLPVYGIPVIVSRGIAAVVATGTNWLLFRLPEEPQGVEMVEPIASLDSSRGWYSVSAWQSGSSDDDADEKLRALVRAAMDHAATLA